GVHRQLLLVSIGWFLGYHITKYENYTYARLDRDMREYIRLHPDDFQQKDKRTYAEILEKLYLKLGREMFSAVKGNL
ncbi:NADH dehydrogenase [ubiquinone] 1 subunit C2-like isoform X1, partial [Acipenser oxyrinchus oxyrinchus]